MSTKFLLNALANVFRLPDAIHFSYYYFKDNYEYLIMSVDFNVSVGYVILFIR